MTRSALEDLGRLLLRVVVAGLMLFHGVDKPLHGPGVVRTDLVAHGLPGILAGAWTRLWAIVYTLSVAFATLLVHRGDFLHLAPTGAWAAELWVFYITTPVVVALLGPGRYALRPGNGAWD